MDSKAEKRMWPFRKKAGKKQGKDAKGSRKSGRFPVQVLNIVVFVLCILLAGSLFLTHTPAGESIRSHLAGNSTSSGVFELESRPAGRALTTEQAAARILPAVVGIVQYQKGSLSETGEGSGIVLSSDGAILTNNHVVEDASRLVVVMHGGKKYTASIIGTDTRTDLAVIRIQASGLTYARFGDSKQCKVGEAVLAIGNPSGLKLAGTVTQGIISALDRNVDVGNGPMNLIQTDAAINPGNSGGALVNLYGQVVGINSAKIAQTGYEGLGFSIPADTAKPVVDSILKYGYVKGRVKFGLKCREIDSVTAQLNEIPQGLYVGYVEPGSSAAANGVKADDVITAVNGRTVKTTDDLITLRDRYKPGETLTLSLYRRSDKQTLQVPVKLEEDRGASDAADEGDW